MYLDDGGLPSAPVPPIGNLIDWRALGRRRRAQLLDAVGTIPAKLATEVRHWVAANPDVADYARFRAKVAVDPTDATRPSDVVEASHQLAQYLCHVAALAAARGRAGRLRPRPADRQPPAGLRDVGQPRPVRRRHGRRRAARHDVSRRPELGLPAAATRRSRTQRLRPVARRRRGAAGGTPRCCASTTSSGVHRLWWVPDGVGPDKGVYVRYPADHAARRDRRRGGGAGTTVVGEDLGTVPEEIIEAMEEWDDARPVRRADPLAPGSAVPRGHGLPTIPAGTVAGLRTHDMEPFAAALRRRRPRRATDAGSSAPSAAPSARQQRATARRPRSPASPQSDAYLVVADLDDLSARSRRTTSPARCCRRSGGGGCAGRRRRRSPTPTCVPPAR